MHFAGIVDNSSLVEEEFRRKTNALRDKYYPIEVDHEMTLQQKWVCIYYLDTGIQSQDRNFNRDKLFNLFFCLVSGAFQNSPHDRMV